MPQELAREQNGISLTSADDRIGLLRRGDHTNAAGGHSSFSADALGELSLISGPDRNCGVRNQTS